MEDDKQNEYDGPDSNREPADENPVAVEEESTVRYEEENREAGQEEYRQESYQQDGYEQESYQQDGYEQESYQRDNDEQESFRQAGYQQNSNQPGAYWQEGGQRNSYLQDSRQNGYSQEEYHRPEYQGYVQPQKQSNMALASLVMGIIGIVTSCCCYGGLIFGSLGILFALLSKKGDTMEGYAKAGLITSIISLFLAALAMIFLFGMMSSSLLTGGGY